MASWQDGYVTDIPYTAGFYRELTPPYLHLLSLLMGVRAAPVVDREYRYCELGCGQGLGTLIAAAANPLGRFVGYDFNPAQIAKANDLAERAGLENIRFVEESFASLAARGEGDGSQFDVIVLHGIYSWISAENRQHIVAFIRSRLKPGGMVYVSYNCMPGWAAFAPVQRLMREFAKRRPGRSDQSVMAAIEFVNQLAAKGARYFHANESVTKNLARMAEKDRTYLAHEYLNEHWEALYHADVAREMEDARLEYVGSATVSDNILALSAPPEIGAMLAGADSAMAETIKDFSVNRQFRRDLFVRGPVRLTKTQFVHELGSVRFMLTVPADRTTLKLSTAAGQLESNEPLLRPLIAGLAHDGGATFAQLAALAELSEAQPWRIAQALGLLVESGQAHPVLAAGIANPAPAQALNSLIIETARHEDTMQFLAAPAIGSGMFVSHPEQLVLLAMRSLDTVDSARLSGFVWPLLRSQNKRLRRDGKLLEDDAENLAELDRRISAFVREQYPILCALKVVAG